MPPSQGHSGAVLSPRSVTYRDSVPKTPPSAPYGSAADLPSFLEMRQQMRAFGWFSWLAGPRKRRELVKQRHDLERQLRHMTGTVDAFAQLLGPRNWVFHSRLPVDQVAAVIQGKDPEQAEQDFIALHRTDEWLPFWVQQLFGVADLKPRQPLLFKALRDYQEDRFYACVLVLVTVMDGYVNDVDKSTRRGLHTRTEQEMQAWDSVVGHHYGLTHVMREFLRPVKTLRVEPVFELHRHGIVHGMETGFDNVVVATKAWNYLFAAIDWATDLEKQKVPDAPTPTWRGLYEELQKHAEWKKAFDAAMEGSSDRFLTPEDHDWSTDPVQQAAEGFLSAWRASNYGRMAETLSPRSSRRTTKQSPAGATRQDFVGFALNHYQLLSVQYLSYGLAIVTVAVTINGELRTVESRWSYESPTESMPVPGTVADAQWSRLFSGPEAWH